MGNKLLTTALDTKGRAEAKSKGPGSDCKRRNDYQCCMTMVEGDLKTDRRWHLSMDGREIEGCGYDSYKLKCKQRNKYDLEVFRLFWCD